MGLERYSTLTGNYFKGADCVLFFFSVEDQYSLEGLDDAVREAKSVTSPTCLCFLVASKVDLDSDIFEDRIVEKQKELQCERLFFISSKTGTGVDKLIDVIASELKKRRANTSSPIRSASHNPPVEEQSKCICC